MLMAPGANKNTGEEKAAARVDREREREREWKEGWHDSREDLQMNNAHNCTTPTKKG